MSLAIPYRSIPDMFPQRVAATPGARAFGYPTDDGGVGWLTWAEVGDRADRDRRRPARPRRRPEDRVAILANTRLEWVLADLGIMCAGAATTTVYPTTEPEDAAFILADSGSKVLIAENADAGRQDRRRRPARPHPRRAHRRRRRDGRRVPVAHPGRAGGRGARARWPRDPDLVDARSPTASRPDHLATLIYTSGTTGRPRASSCCTAAGAGRASRRRELGPAHAGRPAVPVAAAVALVRQDAALRHHPRRPADLCGRPRRQARREPGA